MWFDCGGDCCFGKRPLLTGGLPGWVNGNIPFVVLNQETTIERNRFTALHELGHLLLNFNPSVTERRKEQLCHRFAGAMLFPRTTFYQTVGVKRSTISVSELKCLKESYGISLAALMTRARDLSVISESTHSKFRQWLYMDAERAMEKDLGHYPGREQSNRFRQLLYRATSEELLSMSKAASLANMTLATFRDEFVVV